MREAAGTLGSLGDPEPLQSKSLLDGAPWPLSPHSPLPPRESTHGLCELMHTPAPWGHAAIHRVGQCGRVWQELVAMGGLGTMSPQQTLVISAGSSSGGKH